MPTPDGWLEFIATLLKREGSGPRDRKVQVYRLAQEMAKTPGAWELGLCNLFTVWVDCYRYLAWYPRSITHGLPQDVMQKQPGQTAREWEVRVESRNQRVQRCAHMLRIGWSEDEAVTFVSSEEEWVDAKRISRQIHYEEVKREEPPEAQPPATIPEQQPFQI